jgi:hypothetical protein
MIGVSARPAAADSPPCGMGSYTCVDVRAHDTDYGGEFPLAWNSYDNEYESGNCDWEGHVVTVYLYPVPYVTKTQEYPTEEYQIEVYWELDVYFDGGPDPEDYWYGDDSTLYDESDYNYADFSDFACQFTWDDWNDHYRPSYPTDDDGAAVAAFYDDDFNPGCGGEGNNGNLDLFWGTTTEHSTPAVH